MSSIKKQTGFSTPILLMVFNRPDYVRRQVELLRSIRATQIYIAGDGPRSDHPGDTSACAQVRQEIDAIDWECTVSTHFQEKNLGCKRGVISAVDWFFSNVEEGILLEDDCLPHESFFPYCSQLLEKYRDEPIVGHIAGYNILSSIDAPTSYIFTKHPLCWGWATWRRAWQWYDGEMNDWPTVRKSAFLADLFHSTKSQSYWRSLFDTMHAGKIDTWDYQWAYALFKHGALCILPKENLVQNVGFDARATHTTLPFSPLARSTAFPIHFPLQHPKRIKIDKNHDDSIQSVFEQSRFQKLLRGSMRYLMNLVRL